jgi:hypothetical protein
MKMGQKKGLLKEGQNVNYFCSTWILNFGVVPLFLLATFRFCPIFVFLRSLRFSVTRVLDTITQLLTTLSRATLALPRQAVKGFAVLLSLLGLFCQVSLASETMVLAIGEHREIKALNLSHYINGNREVLSILHQEEQETLILRGSMQGYSELILHDSNGAARRVSIYVLSKRKHLEIYELAENFTGMGLKVTPTGLGLELKGVVKTINDYRLLHRLIAQHGELLKLELSLDPALSQQIIGHIYRRAFEQFADSIACEVIEHLVECSMEDGHSLSDPLAQEFNKEWFVRIRQRGSSYGVTNYRIKLKLVQLEQTDGRELSLGLDGLDLRYSDLFNRSMRSIIEDNRILLRDKGMSLSTLAEPETLLQLDSKATLKIGAEIPYSTAQPTSGASHTQWKFAGLTIELKLERRNNHYQLAYSTGFTRPDGQSVSGNRESSTLFIPLDTPIELFRINYQSIGKLESGVPWLKEIPLLGLLFSSSSNEATYKNLTGVITLERVPL